MWATYTNTLREPTMFALICAMIALILLQAVLVAYIEIQKDQHDLEAAPPLEGYYYLRSGVEG